MNIKGYFFASWFLMLTACATSTLPTEPTPAQLAESKGYELGAPVKSILNYKLDGWNYVSAQAIIIHSSPQQKYLVTLRDRCTELSSREVIGTTATGGSMRAKFDAIVVTVAGASAHGGIANTRKCYIDSIHAITKTAASK